MYADARIAEPPLRTHRLTATLSHDPSEAPQTAPVPRAPFSARAPGQPLLGKFLAKPAS